MDTSLVQQNLKFGVPFGSVLGGYCLSVTVTLPLTTILFVDDNELSALLKAKDWFNANELKLNADKASQIIFSSCFVDSESQNSHICCLVSACKNVFPLCWEPYIELAANKFTVLSNMLNEI